MKTLEAVIAIGSTGIRLMVCEVDPQDKWNIIDTSELPVSLGWDVFTTGYVSRDNLLQCLRILNRFKEQLDGWGVGSKQVRVIATSAIREARNKDTVLDRILVKTGYNVSVIDGIEENRFMYLAVIEVLRQDVPQLQKENSVILEIGGGSTEVLLLEHGKMAAVYSLRLGTVIIEQHMKSMLGSRHDVHRFLEDFIKHAGVNLNTGINMQRIRQFITIGSEAQIVAKYKGTRLGNRTWSIPRKVFCDFVEEVEQYSIDECMAKFQIPYADAKSFPVSLFTYKLFIELTKAQEIIVSDTTIREGLLLSKLSTQPDLQENFFSQVIASALNIGRRYRIDELHAQYVKRMALKIYDEMKDELRLEQDTRLILEVAALLHDIGVFIRGSDHERHSQYIVSHSDIFGLSKDKIHIIALIVRYHRGAMILPDDDFFHSLSTANRTLVLKLAAILRVADALDRGHAQRIDDITIQQRGDTLILQVKDIHDTNLEKQAVTEKSDLFESVFGYTVLLGKR